MKKESRTQQDKESASNKQPVDPRTNPWARTAGRPAKREEARTPAPMVSAPNASRRPAERSGQKGAHKR